MEQPGLGRAGQERCSTVRAELPREARNRHGINFLPGVEPGSVGLQLCLCSGDRSEPVSSVSSQDRHQSIRVPQHFALGYWWVLHTHVHLKWLKRLECCGLDYVSFKSKRRSPNSAMPQNLTLEIRHMQMFTWVMGVGLCP